MAPTQCCALDEGEVHRRSIGEGWWLCRQRRRILTIGAGQDVLFAWQEHQASLHGKPCTRSPIITPASHRAQRPNLKVAVAALRPKLTDCRKVSAGYPICQSSGHLVQTELEFEATECTELPYCLDFYFMLSLTPIFLHRVLYRSIVSQV